MIILTFAILVMEGIGALLPRPQINKERVERRSSLIGLHEKSDECYRT